jgi:nucleotide-binding universal stress UspA family protein
LIFVNTAPRRAVYAAGMFKHILIPTDGSETAFKAVRAGIALAAETGARVTGYCAQEMVPSHIYGEGYVADKQLIAELEKRAGEFAQKNVRAVEDEARAAGVPCATVVTKAALPYRGIVDAAEKNGCDAIVMASNGHRGFQKLLLGSVTQEVLTHSKLPVLVFR